ncbi:MAG: hypothetical protein ACK5G7_03735 [Erysipelotrichaceae bacterium]
MLVFFSNTVFFGLFRVGVVDFWIWFFSIVMVIIDIVLLVVLIIRIVLMVHKSLLDNISDVSDSVIKWSKFFRKLSPVLLLIGGMLLLLTSYLLLKQSFADNSFVIVDLMSFEVGFVMLIFATVQLLGALLYKIVQHKQLK